ncbi:MAG: Flp pilus assembly protein CpaB [Candidatus Eremiobacteraeota bacterium]|nr:Flp pilus assembly protein CpaB [Candidatus Eremiobacteraeota bacterium]MBV8433427.1 Flp pilus assembly protein CpaB [Candidatus Eremiobacteraeota bacterium]MBV8723189.1 Flp pilus assembly protein CpaB [Candidatus Eremiobacteraeota bacterium]
MNRRTITIAVVAVLAFGVALIVYGVLTAPRKSAAPPRNVVIASMNIPASARIVPSMVNTVQKPADQVEPDAFSDPSDAVGMIATSDIPLGAALSPARLARPSPPPQGPQVAVGMRAITIPIDVIKGVGGLLQPGDHVDVLASPPRGASQPVAFAIVRDAIVLAVGTNLAPVPQASGSPAPNATPAPPATTATLLVTPPQAATILSADLNSILRLALRSPHEPMRSLASQIIVYPTPLPAPLPTGTPRGIPVVNGDAVISVQP